MFQYFGLLYNMQSIKNSLRPYIFTKQLENNIQYELLKMCIWPKKVISVHREISPFGWKSGFEG